MSDPHEGLPARKSGIARLLDTLISNILSERARTSFGAALDRQSGLATPFKFRKPPEAVARGLTIEPVGRQGGEARDDSDDVTLVCDLDT